MADETLTLVGVLEAVTERNGWTQFEINVGRQYPVRLSTKKDTIIAQGRAVGQAEAVWSYTESQGGANPHKPGEFYTNRYLSSAELVTAENWQAATSAAAAAGSAGGRPSDDATRRSIERQTIMKAAVPLLGSVPPSTDAEEAFFEFCDHLYEWVNEGVSAGTGATVSDSGSSGDAEQPPPHSDDDIPPY